ncbi:MAG: Gfo/Idh/MocA family oxidoreductase, partial [Armatimonadota bacterium]
QTHIREFLRLGCSIVALVDPSLPAVERTLNEFPVLAGTRGFGSFEEFIKDPQCDMVVISSPHTIHADQVVASLASGLHVLCDKPLVTTVGDAHRVISARDAANRVAAIAYQRHADGAWKWLREAVQDGRFGKIRMVNSHLGQQWLQLTRGSWRQLKSLSGGGQLNDSGSHMLDVLLWATGLRASSVSAYMDFCGTEVDINSTVSVLFTGGEMATLTVVGDAALWHERHFIWFEEAMVALADGTAEVWQRDGTHSKIDQFPRWPGIQENFLAAIESGAEVLAPFECGLRTIELTEAAWRSHDQGGASVKVE